MEACAAASRTAATPATAPIPTTRETPARPVSMYVTHGTTGGVGCVVDTVDIHSWANDAGETGNMIVPAESMGLPLACGLHLRAWLCIPYVQSVVQVQLQWHRLCGTVLRRPYQCNARRSVPAWPSAPRFRPLAYPRTAWTTSARTGARAWMACVATRATAPTSTSRETAARPASM